MVIGVRLQPKGRWFKPQSDVEYCVRRQDKLSLFFSVHPNEIGYRFTLGVYLRWDV